MPRPRCGNDPRAQLTDGDRQAIADFRAYLTRRAQEKTMDDTTAAAITRIRQMADAWEQQFPETIRTATAVEAIRTALERTPPAEPRTFADGGVNDTRELYALQRAITDAGGKLARPVHRAIDAIRAVWDAELRREQDRRKRAEAQP